MAILDPMNKGLFSAESYPVVIASRFEINVFFTFFDFQSASDL